MKLKSSAAQATEMNSTAVDDEVSDVGDEERNDDSRSHRAQQWTKGAAIGDEDGWISERDESAMRMEPVEAL